MDKPKIAQKMPYVLDLQPSTYYWCACGQSKNQPFCDLSHEGSSFTPVKIEIAEAKKVALCGCKMTAGQPFCDMTHTKI